MDKELSEKISELNQLQEELQQTKAGSSCLFWILSVFGVILFFSNEILFKISSIVLLGFVVCCWIVHNTDKATKQGKLETRIAEIDNEIKLFTLNSEEESDFETDFLDDIDNWLDDDAFIIRTGFGDRVNVSGDDLETEMDKIRQQAIQERKSSKKRQTFSAKEVEDGLVWKQRFTVAGTQYRDTGEIPFYKLQKNMDDLQVVKTENFKFIPEPNNPYHSRAIKVIVEDYFVGYVPRELANRMFELMNSDEYRVEGYVKIEKKYLKRGPAIKYAVFPRIYKK